MEECSPDINYNGFSCIDNATIGKLFESIKSHTSTKPISGATHDEIARSQMAQLREHTNCNNDFCVGAALNKEHEVTQFLKPEKTKQWADERAWLSNIDIDAILHSYMRVYPSFYHAGTFPIDFQDTDGIFQTCTSDMCDFRGLRDKINDQVQYISFVFNTHKRKQSGEHWFCAFFDIPSKKLYFNDSVGNQTRYHCKYMTRFQERLKAEFGSFEMIGNAVQKQPYGSGECGLYCIFFITKMLEMRTYCQMQCGSPEQQWYNPKTRSYSHRKSSDADVFCGPSEDFFMSDACMSDMKRYNAYMEQHRYEFFNVRDADGRRISMDRNVYNECPLSGHHSHRIKPKNQKTSISEHLSRQSIRPSGMDVAPPTSARTITRRS